MGQLTLKIVTTEGAGEPVPCQSVHLTVCDDETGRGGGSCGIRPGHARAVFSLAEDGRVTALREGKSVFSGRCAGGFAAVDGGQVTVVTERFDPDGGGDP